uniref:Peptidase A1 domain-containing protein n=1 Tax=Parascaris equorum TaxID=6256 RepID=A0A914RKA7_PAREQ
GSNKGVPGGVITYGGFDTDNCGSVIEYEPLSSASYWQFRIKRLVAGKYLVNRQWDAISDTGTSFNGGPQHIVDRLANIVGANYDDENDVYFMSCDAKPPPLKITIGSHAYTISAENYILDRKKCAFAFFASEFGGFGPSWILGNPFIREYCHIHDVGRKRIGFAPVKHK